MVGWPSIACPHMAVLATLVKKLYIDWTPAMIRSAPTMTAKTEDNTRHAWWTAGSRTSWTWLRWWTMSGSSSRLSPSIMTSTRGTTGLPLQPPVQGATELAVRPWVHQLHVGPSSRCGESKLSNYCDDLQRKRLRAHADQDPDDGPCPQLRVD